MLNIGKLGPGAADYYVGEVATSAEGYYSGRGEAQGRWVGSLASELRLQGAVDPVHFRRALLGRHPHTDELLVRHRSGRRRSSSVLEELGADLDTARAAAYLGVSARYVRSLLEEGGRYRDRLRSAIDDEPVPEPSAFLAGERSDGASGAWRVSVEELDRFKATRREVQFRPGYDLTLRPPKSVSVLWALADGDHRRAIRQAHREAVDEVVRYYEDRAIFARAGGGGRRLLPSDGLVAAAFDHRTSRAGDPLLHTHVVTANMTRVRTVEGEQVWRAIPGAGLFEHAKTAGCLYQAHLRHLLASRLGLRFEPVVNGAADVIGVPKELVRHFSRRRAEIEAALAETGSSSARAAQVATLQTRRAKDYQVEPDALRDRWLADAASLGVDVSTITACFDQPRDETPVDRERLFATLAGPHGLTELAATFSRTDVIEAIASAVNAALPAVEVEAWADVFLGSGRTLLVESNRSQRGADRAAGMVGRGRRSYTQQRYTTPELATIEADLLTIARANRSSPPSVGGELESVLAARGELSGEQVVMIRAACTSSAWVVPVAGRPGAGKTFAVEAIVAFHVAAGVPIVGAAVSANAAAELETAAGFARSTGMPATTIARLLLDLDEHGLASQTVIVVDEASMLGTRALARLVDHARSVGGSVLLVGDPDQHGPVEVGGVFAHLCRQAGADLVRLVENNRQTDPADRLTIDDYRQGRVAEALARYDDTGRVVRSATAGKSFDAMVADWYTQRLAEGHADPMIAGPNSTRRALNERARTLLKANGDLTGTALMVAGREFMVGDDVVARRNDRSLRGERDGFVRNGSTGRITALHAEDQEVTVEFDREGRVRIPRRYLLAARLDHGYARTTYGVQGATHTVGRYHPTGASGFEEGYVAITRARHATRVYVVDGTITSASELDHAPPEAHHHGLATITGALARRTSDSTVADLAPGLERVANLAESTSLAELTRHRRHLDRILADAPADPTVDIDTLADRISALQIRRRAWIDHRPTGDRTERAVTAIDRQLDRHAHTARRLDAQGQRYEQWTTTHAPTLEQRALIRRAEHAVETRVRDAALADVDDPGRAVLGDPPVDQAARRAWRQAIGDAAIYRTRHNSSPEPGAEPAVSMMGPRPRGAGRWDWDHAAASVTTAVERQEVSPDTPDLTL
jgi:conjugative relaxase-like TrwC/TraI family protein